MSGNPLQTGAKPNYTGTGHRANYSGPSQVKGTGPITMFGEQERAWKSAENARLHTPYPGAGSYGVGYMKPCGKDGAALTTEEAKGFRMQFNGRNYPLNQKGVLAFCDNEAWNPIIKDELEMENYLSKLSVYILGGNEVFAGIFGEDIIGHCKTKGDEDYDCNGLTIPGAIAKVNCEPSYLRLFDPSQTAFVEGMAKLRAILRTYPVAMLGALPSWDMGLEGAGEKNDAKENPDAGSKGPAAPAAAVEAPQQQNL